MQYLYLAAFAEGELQGKGFGKLGLQYSREYGGKNLPVLTEEQLRSFIDHYPLNKPVKLHYFCNDLFDVKAAWIVVQSSLGKDLEGNLCYELCLIID